jgi:uncharacterized membrane protein YeiH
MTYVLVLDIIGTLVFAISGALTAANKEFDLMGISIVAFVTALGGGTLRDMIIGIEPVTWATDIRYLLIVGLGVLIAFLFRSKLEPLRKAFFVFDATGLAVFSIGGLELALQNGIQPVYAIFMGMISATMGGVTRDILCQVTPLIFREEIYASAGLIGATAYLVLSYTPLSTDFITIATILLVLVIRILAVRFKIGLPKLKSP